MIFPMIQPGLQGELRMTVEPVHTARHLGSGNVEVFATPEMVRLMERAAVAAVDHLLPEGYRTVGIALNVRHLAATPMGMEVVARTQLTGVHGHRLTFQVEVCDEAEKVGEGTHVRFIVDLAKFQAGVEEKRGSG